MAGNPLKFRCYQCNQLLGVSRSRVGTVVSCPKCQAGLIVPDLADGGDGGGDDRQGDAATRAAMESGIPLDLINIRPEDIRVEPGIDWARPNEPMPDFAAVETVLQTEEEPPPRRAAAAPEVVMSPVTPVPATPAPAPASAPQSPRADEESVIPPINFDAAVRRPSRSTVTTSRDVVLPKTAVAAWSLFVLLAQGLAFLAGLLAGHFLWKVH